MFTKEFRAEAATTRRFLERFPQEHAEWRPHEKSMTLAALASHIVDTPAWAYSILDTDFFDLDTAEFPRPVWKAAEELVEHHERIAADFAERLSGCSDAFLGERWQMTFRGQKVLDLPRYSAIRTVILSHLVHHRGQLSVFYRLLDVPVPGAYGPSADEN